MPTAKTMTDVHSSRNWCWLLALGILLLILGIVGLGMTVGLTVVSMYFFGILLIIAGVSQILDTFYCKEWKGVLWHAFIATLYILAGVMVIHDPVLTSTMITAFIASVLIVIGISRFMMAIALRHQRGFGWLLLAGLISTLLGILIFMQWPMSGLWVIGLFIAIELIVDGWTYIFLALSMRR